MMKQYIFLIAILVLLQGCSIKEDDSTTDKFVKHTINTPAYIVLGAGAIATEGSKVLMTAILYPPYVTYKYLRDINNTAVESENNTCVER